MDLAFVPEVVAAPPPALRINTIVGRNAQLALMSWVAQDGRLRQRALREPPKRINRDPVT
jgi:hypothetical protein